METYTFNYKTIIITREANNRLKQFKNASDNFSDLITRIVPKQRNLSDILNHYKPNEDLAMSIQRASEEMRFRKM